MHLLRKMAPNPCKHQERCNRHRRGYDRIMKQQDQLLNKSNLHEQEGELDQALADLDQAVRLSPSARNYYSRSLIQRERGDARKADRDAQRAVELDDRYEDVVE